MATTRDTTILMGWSLDTGTHQTCEACRQIKPYADFRRRGRGEFAHLLRYRCRDCEAVKRPVWWKRKGPDPVCVHEQNAYDCRLCRLERDYADRMGRRSRRESA